MNSSFDRPTLPAVSWTARLKEEDRDLLASYGEFYGLQPDHDLIRQGEDQKHLFFVISGRLEARRTGLQDDVVVGIIQGGELFGEIALFDPGPASAHVRALEFCQIWRIDHDSLNDFLKDNPVSGNHLLTGLATLLSQRLRGMMVHLVDAKGA